MMKGVLASAGALRLASTGPSWTIAYAFEAGLCQAGFHTSRDDDSSSPAPNSPPSSPAHQALHPYDAVRQTRVSEHDRRSAYQLPCSPAHDLGSSARRQQPPCQQQLRWHRSHGGLPALGLLSLCRSSGGRGATPSPPGAAPYSSASTSASSNPAARTPSPDGAAAADSPSTSSPSPHNLASAQLDDVCTNVSEGPLNDHLLWLTQTLGLPRLPALDVLPRLAPASLEHTLEPARQWLLALGFDDADVGRVARHAPAALAQGAALLEDRLRFYGDTCSMPVDSACALLRQAPALWHRDPTGPVMQGKLAFWRDVLGHSLSSVTADFLTAQLSLVGCRRQLLQGLGLAAHPGAGKMLTSTSCPAWAFALAARERDASGHLQAVLVPLAATLLQGADNRATWRQLLDSAPPSCAGKTTTVDQRVLYTALWQVYREDWLMRPVGRQMAAEALVAREAERQHAKAAKRAFAPPDAAGPGMEAEARRAIGQLRVLRKALAADGAGAASSSGGGAGEDQEGGEQKEGGGV